MQDDGEHQRINLWLDLSAYFALRRLAHRDAVTQAALIAALIHRADEAVIASLDENKPEWDEYFQRRPRSTTHPAGDNTMP